MVSAPLPLSLPQLMVRPPWPVLVSVSVPPSMMMAVSLFRQALAARSLLSLVSTPPLLVTVMVVVELSSLIFNVPSALMPFEPTAVVAMLSVPP